jgi:cell division protein FtsL
MTENNARPTRRSKRTVKLTLSQAFKQAPWRNQVQFAGLFLLALVVVLLVASVYLSISGEAAAAGLRAYSLNIDRQDLERQIADRKSKIADITSSSVMEERAKAMGFERIDPSEAVYISVPGYTGKQSVVLAAPPGIDESDRSLVKSIYRQSLWDWLFSGINRLSASVGGNVQ